jgi:hypothetical protein
MSSDKQRDILTKISSPDAHLEYVTETMILWTQLLNCERKLLPNKSLETAVVTGLIDCGKF